LPRPTLQIVEGPNKPALQWALAYPDREQVHFGLEGDAVDAKVHHMNELGEGFTFELSGVLTSGTYKGQPYRGVYSVETRKGSLAID